MANVAKYIQKAIPELRITIDPVENRGFEYHSGVTFNLFSTDVSGEIGTGGRYLAKYGDSNSEESTGFTLFVDTILKALPKIKFEGRVQYIFSGKLRKKLYPKEKLLIDGCHSTISGKNLSDYLRTIKHPKYGVWSMMKNKDPSNFIKQFKGVFKKVYTIPISGEKNSMSPKVLSNIAKKNNINTLKFENFDKVLKNVSSKERKIICVFGSLYQCGIVLNKN